MKKKLADCIVCTFIGILLLSAAGTAWAEGLRFERVAAGFVGAAGVDDLQGCAAGADGTLYVVGNLGTNAAPDGVQPVLLGKDETEPRCGHGFVACLSPLGHRVKTAALFGKGIVFLTSVVCVEDAVYVSGYASKALESLLADKPGFMREYPLEREMELIKSGKILEACGTPQWKKDILEGRPGLGRYGAPCVLRLSQDLSRIESGTYLEGWQQVWNKRRNITTKPYKTFPVEYFWQPTCLAPLGSGDLLASHDGGYFRLQTEDDLAISKGEGKWTLKFKLPFYDTCDRVSRLSPDLAERVWCREIHTPKVNQEVVSTKVKIGWPHAHYGNPRTHRMRLDAEENIYLCGWSATQTSKEPWWSPFILKLSPKTGAVTQRVFEFDPMSGGGHRMGGAVSDTAVLTVRPRADGKVLTSLMADGGNTLMRRGKMQGGYPHVKLTHWTGITRLLDPDAGLSGFINGVACGGRAWTVDLASLPDGGVIEIGRWNFGFGWTDDAWQQVDKPKNPSAYLRTLGTNFTVRFSTPLRGIVPFQIEPVASNRYLIVGRADLDNADTESAFQPEHGGESDGFFTVVEALPDDRLHRALRLRKATDKFADKAGVWKSRLAVAGRTLPDDKTPELAAARKALADAEAELERLRKETALGEVEALRLEWEQKVAEALKDTQYGKRNEELEKLAKLRDDIEDAMPELVEWQVNCLGVFRVGCDKIADALRKARTGPWYRTEFAKDRARIKELDAELARNGAVRKALKTRDAAFKALREVEAALAEKERAFHKIRRSRDRCLEQSVEHWKELDALFKAAAEGDEYTIEGPGKLKVECWIPKGCKTVRGIIMGHGPVEGTALCKRPWTYIVAAEKALAIMRVNGSRFGTFDYTNPEIVEQFLSVPRRFAEMSGHPELPRVPILTVGHSTSGIYARNVAYWKPERVFGVIHIKSGNLQERPEQERSMAGVPFLGISGEFECYGPRGGLREEYGRQTQWIIFREQLLRKRREDDGHLLSLLVHGGGGHTGWDDELSRICALFISKAADARLPALLPEGNDPVACREIDIEQGWLTPADITDQPHPPAPCVDYAGDKVEAMWHLDGELARTIFHYHHRNILIDDPSKAFPVPADWP